MMRWPHIAGRACVLAPLLLGHWQSALAETDSSQAAQKPCFEFVAGRPDTPPSAPMLINTCNGQTFVLAKQSHARRGGKQARYVWQQLPMRGVQSDLTGTRAAQKSGCFAYDNRLFCQ
jgi:hypothetical protein